MLRGGLQYSRGGRGPNLPSDESGEATLIREAPGGLALVGFFCNGEISHNRLYGCAGVLTLYPWRPVRRGAQAYRLRHNRDGETSQ